MIIDSIEKIMEISMMDAIADLKSGKELDMQFYLFFKDGYPSGRKIQSFTAGI